MNTAPHADDLFEVALAVDACVLAYERCTAGVLVHRPVDARVLTTIASCFDFGRDPLRAVALVDRIVELQQRIERLWESPIQACSSIAGSIAITRM